MLKKKQRLPRHMFNVVRRSRLVLKNKEVSLRFLHVPRNDRYSVVVPKSIFSKATDRNTLRRRIYGFLEPGTGLYCIIYILSQPNSLPKLRQTVQELITRARE